MGVLPTVGQPRPHQLHGWAPPAGPGFYIAEYLSYYTANKRADIPLPNPWVDVWANLNQFLYQSDTPILFGGKWGLDVIVPFAWIDSSPGQLIAQ